MSRSEETGHAASNAREQASSELGGFGLDLPDESWLGRIREAERDPFLGSIGAYELIEEISRGAQGIVYRARQPNTNRDVALKRLLAGRFATASARERFTREIEVAAALNHANIVRVYGAELIQDQPILAMEWVDGLPVDAWAFPKDADPASLPNRLRMFLHICAAVQHAHQRGVIHRDLKPSNILVDGQGHPHVLDFGLAKSLAASKFDDAGGEALTHDFVGTPLYAAPEQARSDHLAVDVRTDVYSLGVILYQLLTGKTPHSGSLHQLLADIQNVDPAPPSRLQQSLSRELDAIVLKALSKNPEGRYQSVDAMAADVRAYLEGGVVGAHPPTAAYRFFKIVRGHRVAFAFATTVLIFLTVFAVVSYLQANRLEVQRSATERRFEEVRSLARTLIFDVHDEIAELKGALLARELIVETGLEYLDALAADAGYNAELLLECADGYFRVATLQGNPNGANLGQTDAAMESCKKGLEMVDTLREALPDNGDILRYAAIGQHTLANILTAIGQTANAIDAYEMALELKARSATLDPDSADQLPEYEHILADYAACFERSDRFAEAEAQLVEVVRLLRNRLQSTDAPSDVWELKLGNALASLGHVRVQQGLADEAGDPLQEAIDILEKAVDTFPTRDNIWRSLVIARTARARASAMRGETRIAKAELEWVIDVHNEMVASDPTNVTSCHDLAAAHHFLGKLLDEDGDAQGALVQFEEMLRIRRQLADSDPSSMIARRGVAIGLDMTGTVLRKIGDLEEALARHQGANAIFKEISAEDPDNPRQKRSVAISAFYLGQVYQELAQGEGVESGSQEALWRHARDQYVQAKSLMEELQAAGHVLPGEAGIVELLSSSVFACDERIDSGSETNNAPHVVTP